MRGFLVVLAVLVALAGAAAAHAGGPGILLGVTEDVVKQPTLAEAKAKMDVVERAGFNAIRLSQVWQPGQTKLTDAELAPLKNAVDAAQQDGVTVLLTVTQFGSRTTPLTDDDQKDFATFAAFLAKQLPSVRRLIVSNEPNLNRYWLPQFGPSGEDVAAPAYEALLARTYDALKDVDPQLQVIGGALAPRGVDLPNTGRDTHSPTAFIRDLAAAYRASGRAKPIMDALAIHPYEDNSSVAPVDGTHPSTSSISIADYDKLVGLLRDGFSGTAQRGATLPIVYDEFGVESDIPPARTSLYTGTEPTTIRPVDEQTQALFYRQALGLAFCQPNVQGISLFHVWDEVARAGWQSGLYYINGQPKASLAPTRAAMAEVRRGVVAKCADLKLRVRATLDGSGLTPKLSCDLDCSFVAWLQKLPKASTTFVVRGTAVGGVAKRISFKRPAAGLYRVRVAAAARVNPGPLAIVNGKPFRLPAL